MRRKYRYITLLLFLVLNVAWSPVSSQQQDKCATDLMHSHLMETDPAYKASFLRTQEQVRAIAKNQSKQNLTSQSYTIPVVVHVINLGEPIGTGTNISDAQIQGAIQGLNDRFRNIIGNGSLDTEINFCLAVRDPNGCPTTGINRVNGSSVPNYSVYGIRVGGCSPGANEDSVKSLSRWPVADYYNIWVVNYICYGYWGGYAYYPNGGVNDGTLIRSISMTNASDLLSHEVGHGLFLFHTFAGDNNSCPVNTDCTVNGDNCCDTPPHKTYDCADTNPCSTTGNWDNSRYNYMSYCYNPFGRFTPDQKNRMQNTMLVAPRASLATSLGCTPTNFTVSISANGPTSFCQGNSVTLTASSGSTYAWSNGATTQSITVNSSGNYSVSVTAGTCSGTSSPITVSVNQPPNLPGAISGSQAICKDSSRIYSIQPVPNATDYTWTLPAGWSGTSTSNTIQVTAGANSGNVSVKANNNCGSSAVQNLAVTVSEPPAQPTQITGSNTICKDSTQTYSINAVANATGYSWILPAGWSGSSTSNTIQVTAGANSGNVSVKANNNCGSSPVQSLAVTVNQPPAQPAQITGSNTICKDSIQTYSINAVANATGYTWVLPAGWSGSSTSNTIQVTAGSTSGTISVKANNNCGSSPIQSLAVTVNQPPGQPTQITGSNTICKDSTQTYSINAVANATGYIWILPAGWSGNSTTNTIQVIPGANSGTLKVKAINDCGSSIEQTLNITVDIVPSQPATITGNTTACLGTIQTYSIVAVPNATSYLWTLPAGWTGSSTTNSIQVTVGANNDTIRVKAVNSCGNSSEQKLGIIINPPPGQAGSITGNDNVSVGQVVNYSVSPIANATGYNWQLSGGGTIQSGQNTTTTMIKWDIAGNYILTITGTSNCGNGVSKSLTVAVSPITGIVNPDNQYQIRVIPNPSPGEFYLTAKGLINKKIKIDVLNNLGQLIYKADERVSTNDYTRMIDLMKMADGIYYIRLTIGNKVYVRKIIKTN